MKTEDCEVQIAQHTTLKKKKFIKLQKQKIQNSWQTVKYWNWRVERTFHEQRGRGKGHNDLWPKELKTVRQMIKIEKMWDFLPVWSKSHNITIAAAISCHVNTPHICWCITGRPCDRNPEQLLCWHNTYWNILALFFLIDMIKYSSRTEDNPESMQIMN